MFDGDAVSDLRLESQNRAKQLIEDFMVAANVTTARFLEQQGLPVGAAGAALARALGADRRAGGDATARSCRAQPDARALEAFLAERRRPRSPSAFPICRWRWSSCSAAASTPSRRPASARTEHFGLAVRDYAHSTAPNRRFPDLLTQRLVKAALADQPPPYTVGELGRAGAALHGRRGRRGQGRAAGAKVGRRPAAAGADRRDVRRAS